MIRRRVWIDTDPAVADGNGEVDDAFALVQALRSPELDVVGISAVFGNSKIDSCYAMAQEIVGHTGRTDVPVYRGCGQKGDRQANDATEALCAALAQGPLTIIAIGPLTTIAAALCQPGAALANVEDIVFCGGRRIGLDFRVSSTQKKLFPDMNFECDPAAAEELLALGLPMTLAGWEVCSEMWLTPADLDRLRDEGDDCAAWLAASARKWLGGWQDNFGTPGFTPFDTLSVGWLLVPDLFVHELWPTGFDHSGEKPLFWADPGLDGPKARYLRSVDNDAFRADLMKRLLRSSVPLH